MFTRIRNRRNVKIIFSLSFVMAFLIGVYTYIDIVLINAADQALYRAKQSGRNKVVVSGPEIEVTEA